MKNDYKICGDYAIIYIDSPKYGRKECLIDTIDLDKCLNIGNKWILKFDKHINGFYVYTRYGLPLHRFVTNCPKNMVVDHINSDTFDNRQRNLRICTVGQNNQNVKIRKDNKSGFRGVTFHSRTNKWQADLRVNGKTLYVGLFESIELANAAVIAARAKLMPFSKEALIV